MSAITVPTVPTATTTATAAANTDTVRRPVWRHGLAATAAATVAVTAAAAAAKGLGVSFEIEGSAIPVLGFAQLTAFFSLIGVALAAILNRFAARPRTAFLRTTIALTVLSVVPDLTFGFDAASAATLIGTHLLAAVIVIPVLARRLRTARA